MRKNYKPHYPSQRHDAVTGRSLTLVQFVNGFVKNFLADDFILIFFIHSNRSNGKLG